MGEIGCVCQRAGFLVRGDQKREATQGLTNYLQLQRYLASKAVGKKLEKGEGKRLRVGPWGKDSWNRQGGSKVLNGNFDWKGLPLLQKCGNPQKPSHRANDLRPLNRRRRKQYRNGRDGS